MLQARRAALVGCDRVVVCCTVMSRIIDRPSYAQRYNDAVVLLQGCVDCARAVTALYGSACRSCYYRGKYSWIVPQLLQLGVL